MKYEKLREALQKESKKNLSYQLDKLNRTQQDIDKLKASGKDIYSHKTPEEILNYVVMWDLNKSKPYAGDYETQKQKTILALKRKYQKRLDKELSYLKSIEEAEPLKNRLVITVEWKASRMWRRNPNASDNFGNGSGSIGGCGYDKQSTAVARILNQHLYLIKLMCDVKERYLKENPTELNNNDIHRKVLGYGSGYGIIPRFEGGVGVSCFETILKRLGYSMQNITSTKNTDVYLIDREKEGV